MEDAAVLHEVERRLREMSEALDWLDRLTREKYDDALRGGYTRVPCYLPVDLLSHARRALGREPGR